MDYHREKSVAFEQLVNEYEYYLADQLQKEYNQNHDQLNETFYKKINQSLKRGDDDYLSYDVFVLNNDMEITYNQHTQKKSFMRVQDHSMVYSTMLTVHLDHMDESIRYQIEEKLKEQITNDHIKINLASPTINAIPGEYVSQDINDISYIAIENEVIYDQRQSDDQIRSFVFNDYESPQCYLTSSLIHLVASIEGIHCIDYAQETNDVFKRLEMIIPQDSQSEGSYQFENTQGTFYDVHYIPLVKKGSPINENGTYNVDDIDGYLIFYTYDLYGNQKIIQRVVYSKMIIYILSFILCLCFSLLLSYILTKRIKKINQSTLLIADNHFDIHLNEKSKDELGHLSHHINQMSQKLKLTMQRLNDEITYVKKLEGMRKEFIAHFTHEIKTPLSIINGYIELIEIEKDEQKKQQYLQSVNQEIERINQLVMSMLDLSRLESGHVQLNKEEIDLEDLLMTVIEMFEPLLKNKQIHVVMGQQFPHIQGDYKELKIVFQNFMSNAMKHTPHNGYIYIDYQNGTLSFENEGEHLTEQQIDKIWDTYISNDRQGTGLGLAICRAILDLHKFTYSVNNSDKGVQFRIHFQKNLLFVINNTIYRIAL